MTDADIDRRAGRRAQAILNPSGGDVNGSVDGRRCRDAHGRPTRLANDVTAFLLQELQVPGTAQTLLAVLD